MAAIDFRLVPLDPEGCAEALHAIFGDEESCRFLPRPAQATVADTAVLLHHWNESHADTSWAIEDAATKECLGRIQTFIHSDDVWEVACMIVPQARGHRLAERALPSALDFTFDQKGARRIFADIDPENYPCIRTFERLGFAREGHLRATYLTHLGVRDSLIFGMVQGDPRPWRTPPQT